MNLPTAPALLGAVKGGLFVTASVNGEIKPVLIFDDFAAKIAMGWDQCSNACYHQNFADPVVEIHFPADLMREIWRYVVSPHMVRRLSYEQAEQVIAAGSYFSFGTSTSADPDIYLL